MPKMPKFNMPKFNMPKMFDDNDFGMDFPKIKMPEFGSDFKNMD